MDFITRQVEIAENEGFLPAKDLFGRSEFGQKLMKLVSMTAEPMVIVLDGEWGTGKTTFMKQWCGLLKNNDIPVIYFDAFANDYHDDFFSSLAAETYACLPKGKDLSNFLERAVAAGRILLPSLAKITLNSLISIEGEDIDAAKEAYGALTSKALNEEIRKRIEKRDEEKEAIAAFKSSLSSVPELLAQEVTASTPDGVTTNHPLIFVIDELDRCKPSYALSAIETIKHFYSVKNIHFIIVTNLNQLESIVENQYGVSDGKKYLEKFYDFKVFLKNLTLMCKTL